jgi:hypothetical protein
MSVNLTLFDARTYPAGMPLVGPGKAGDGWEYDEVIRFFSGKCLADVTLQSLRSDYRTDWTAAHHLLSAQALPFFLPALMRLSQDNYEDSSHNAGVLADNLTFFFLRMALGEMDNQLLALLNAYSSQQLGAISTFLREMSDCYYKEMGDFDEAAQALAAYWARY